MKAIITHKSSIRVERDRDFNDLVVERVLFETPENTKKILENMFPNKDVNVFVNRGGETVIGVDDIEIIITNRDD